MNKKLIYLSSPYSLGNKKLNVLSHMSMFEALSKRYPNCVFFAPLVYAHFGFDRKDPFWKNEKTWMSYDLEMLKRCNAIYLFDAEVAQLNEYHQSWKNSIGCKKERGLALQIPIPIYTQDDFDTFDKFLRLL